MIAKINHSIGKTALVQEIQPYAYVAGQDPRASAKHIETYLKLAAELSSRNLAYVHISDQTKWADVSIPKNYLKEFRQAYHGTLILAGGYLRANGQAALDANEADLIAMGKPFLENPHLLERRRNNWPLNPPDKATFYTAGPQRYLDYPICRKTERGRFFLRLDECLNQIIVRSKVNTFEGTSSKYFLSFSSALTLLLPTQRTTIGYWPALRSPSVQA